MHNILKTMTLLLVAAFILTTYAYADFPYNIQWLQYANERVIYQINTSDINSNTANIYVTVNIDPTTLQNYINKWSSYCDPEDHYDWFYPTPFYVSTSNKTPRRVEITSFANWQTFNVGSCGTVDLPTQITVKLPNGILDGGDNYANYTHYIVLYFKYPYTEDAADNLSTIPPEEYNILSEYSVNNTGTLVFGPTGRYRSTQDCGVRATRKIDMVVNLSDKTPVMVCANMGSPGAFGDMPSCISFHTSDGTTINIDHIGLHCYDLRDLLASKGLSGTVTIDSIEVGNAVIYWYWVVPQNVYKYMINQ